MRNKEHIRARFRARKKMAKKLKLADTTPEEKLNIKKELGMITLRELLGDKYPIKSCKFCGKRAYTELELYDFLPDRNLCKSCRNIRQQHPEVQIVGTYSKWRPVHTCTQCGETNPLFFYKVAGKKSSLCKCCYGSHKSVYGKPMKSKSTIPITIGDTEYPSIAEAGRVLELPYNEVRAMALGLKDTDIC